MSSISIVDKSGGKYQAVISFNYGECERLPFNILRRMGASIEIVPDGGINAIATFNIRTPGESAAFLEMLDLFGDSGSYVHGSAADPDDLARTAPPEDTGDIYLSDDEDSVPEDSTGSESA